MKVKLLDSNCVPFKKHDTDAGWDLKCQDGFTIGRGKTRAVPLGISVEIPKGFVGLIFPRSSYASEKGLVLANTVGVIDSDYRGELIAMIRNEGDRILRIQAHERIVQLVIVPIHIAKIEIVTELSETERGDGGFGSTNEKSNEEAIEEIQINKQETKAQPEGSETSSGSSSPSELTY